MQRISLINYDVLRELCDSCRKERFHFVPLGAEPATGPCRKCGAESKLAEMSDTAVWRLISHANGDVVVVPMIYSNSEKFTDTRREQPASSIVTP